MEAAKTKADITFVMDSNVTALEGENTLNAITLTDKSGGSKTIPVEGLFIEVGQIPDNGPFAQLAELDGGGYFAAGEDCHTKTPGVFVAGDCRSKELRQLTTAAADGSVAATAACQWLDER